MKRFDKGITRLQAIIAVAIIAVAAIVGGFSLYNISMPSTPGTIRIGVTAPLTGFDAYRGAEMKRAATLAANQIEASKGGIFGKHIELFFGDDESKPEKGVAVVERLIIEDHVIAIAGGVSSTVDLATIEATNRHGIPHIVAGSVADGITSKGYLNVFRTCCNVTAMCTTLVPLIKEVIKPATYATLAEESGFGPTAMPILIDALKKAYPQANLTLRETIPSGSAEYYPVIGKIKNAQPDLVVICLSGTTQCAFLKQARELDLPCPVIALNNLFPEFMSLATPAAAEYYVYLQKYDTSVAVTEKTTPFVQAWKAEYGTTPSDPAIDEYIAMTTLFDALGRAGSTAPDALLQALRETNMTGIFGQVRFGTYQQNNMMMFVGQIQNGTQHMIWPLGAGTSTYQRPSWAS